MQAQTDPFYTFYIGFQRFEERLCLVQMSNLKMATPSVSPLP